MGMHLRIFSIPAEERILIKKLSHNMITCAAQVRARQLWGNEIYTHDSDLVAVLMHCGFYNHALSAPPPSALEVRAVVQPLPPQPYYNSCARNSIRSRAWGAAVGGCSYRVRFPAHSLL